MTIRVGGVGSDADGGCPAPTQSRVFHIRKGSNSGQARSPQPPVMGAACGEMNDLEMVRHTQRNRSLSSRCCPLVLCCCFAGGARRQPQRPLSVRCAHGHSVSPRATRARAWGRCRSSPRAGARYATRHRATTREGATCNRTDISALGYLLRASKRTECATKVTRLSVSSRSCARRSISSPAAPLATNAERGLTRASTPTRLGRSQTLRRSWLTGAPQTAHRLRWPGLLARWQACSRASPIGKCSSGSG